jgi:TetR/AcrR family transcriptional regulator, regulator of cefoperazone and chloramphenicol sensitivity
MSQVAMADLTAKAKIRHIALGLFAKKGFAATSMRMVAQKAGVSPALIAHHYGSKDGLRSAVDQAVLHAFGTEFEAVEVKGPSTEIAMRFGHAVNKVVIHNQDVRGYIRRSFLDDALSGRSNLLDALLEMVARTLDKMQAAGMLRQAEDTTWRAMQVLLVVFGPTIFEPALQSRMPQLFGEQAVEQRLRANVSLFERGLFK